MELNKALAQISEIHAQVLKSEIFSGYRAITMASTGALALGAAGLQQSLMPAESMTRFILYWLLVACAGAFVCGADIFFRSMQQERASLRRRSILVVAQVLPALLVGAVISVILVQKHPSMLGLLPGLWCLLFALSILSSRLQLPKTIGWVAAYYVLAGIYLLWIASPSAIPSPWCMGMTFGFGQLAMALVIQMNLPRRELGS